MRRSLPVAVSLKRLAAPRWVLSFFFGLEALRGIAKPFVLLPMPFKRYKFRKSCEFNCLQPHRNYSSGFVARNERSPYFFATMAQFAARWAAADPPPFLGASS